MSQSLRVQVSTLDSLFSTTNLTVPSYQRPYTWTKEQVSPLLEDLSKVTANAPVILGTLILFKNQRDELEIVDGQQRLITLSIFFNLIDPLLPNQFLDSNFAYQETIQNIKSNAKMIGEFIRKKGKHHLYILPNQIHFIVVFAPTIEDAFTFFDSQNNRGKPLDDSDILKAHHLRFIKDDELAENCAAGWELIQKDLDVGLELLLETILGRGRKFSRKEISDVNIKKEFKSQRDENSYSEHYQISKYQQSPIFQKWHYDPLTGKGLELFFNIDGLVVGPKSVKIIADEIKYLPFQATQSIEGGELFFWFTQKYYNLFNEVFDPQNPETTDFFKELLRRLDAFSYNTGAKYVHGIYLGALLFYVDKFGYEQLDQVASHLFFSVYWLRFKQSAVQYSSIFKFTRENFNPFSLIAKAGFAGYLLTSIDGYLEGKYNNLRQSEGIRRHMFDYIVKPWDNGLFQHFPELIPNNLKDNI